MKTETQNLQYTGVLSVLEKQLYTREDAEAADRTDVETTVTFMSRFGQQKLLKSSAEEEGGEQKKKPGFFSSWSTSTLQRTIEATGMQRTRNALVKSKEGMNVVLERMREGGLSGVLEGMRRDREGIMGAVGGERGRKE